MIEKILTQLKPKAASFGFNEEELRSVAESLATNLEDDATDEIINAQVGAVIPALKIGQAFATRVINKQKPPKPETPKVSATPEDKSEDEPSWFKKFREETEAKIATLQEEKTKTTQRSKLESLLKDTGVFGANALKHFDRMTFTDEDFESYLEETKADLAAFNQERADAGLATLGKPLGKSNGTAKPKEASEKEVEEVIKQLNI